ncbi:hypothetical protein KJ682_05005 [bacterium]|nr:hypothetical protein [bacterium]
MKTSLLITAFLLITGSSLAGPLVTVTPLDAKSPGLLAGESFEAGMPPSGWYQTTSNQGSTWRIWSNFGYDGSQCAHAPMDIMGEPVDEKLGFHTTYSADEILTFALMTTPAVNGGLRVTVGGDVVFDSSTDWTLFELVWGLVEIDLGQTNHIGETDVDICFHYYGSYAADVFLDLVAIEENPVDVDAAAWGGIKSLFR